MSKLPEAGATEVEVHDLGGDDVHERAVMSWRDKSGKKQHAYTAEFHAANAAKKWARVERIAPRVPEIRAGLVTTIRSADPGTPDHEGAVIAAVIADTGLRPGNPTSASKHQHYGVATMRGEHVSIVGGAAHIEYVGKAGKTNVATVDDPDVVAALQAYKEKAGDGEMFSPSALDSAREAAGEGVKLKDFRTIHATKSARQALAAVRPPPPLAEAPKKRASQIKRVIAEASKMVAARLNNTPAVARKSYIHPNVWKEWGQSLGIEVPA